VVPNRPALAHPADAQPATGPKVSFRYVGQTRLTVIGPASGKRYQFEGSGAILSVDPRDVPALETISRLKRLKQFSFTANS
jgi:hypothetical protein